MLGAEDRVEHLTDGKVGRKGALSADEEQIGGRLVRQSGWARRHQPHRNGTTGRARTAQERAHADVEQALRLLGVEHEDVQIELSVRKQRRGWTRGRRGCRRAHSLPLALSDPLAPSNLLAPRRKLGKPSAAVRRLDLTTIPPDSCASSTSAAAGAATEDELRAYVGRHWLVLSNEREAAINGRVGECVGFSHCEGLLHVRVPGERQLLRLTPASVAEPPADATLAAIAAAPPPPACLPRRGRARRGAGVRGGRPPRHRAPGERVRLAVEALGRGDEMEVVLRCGEAGEVAEAAATAR